MKSLEKLREFTEKHAPPSHFGLLCAENVLQFLGGHNIPLHLQFAPHEGFLGVQVPLGDAQEVCRLHGESHVPRGAPGRAGVHGPGGRLRVNGCKN